MASNTNLRPPMDTAEIQAMLVSRDQEAVALFSNVFCEMGVGVQHYAEESSAIARLDRARFEAVVLDLESIRNIAPFVDRVHESPSSRNALIFAVATPTAGQHALQPGINFVVERPLQRQRVTSILRIAYGLMLQDRRRYFRHAISAPVRLKTAAGAELHCATINVSRNGTAVCAPPALEVGDALDMTFDLPEVQSSISAQGVVVWNDKHGKAGLRFKCSRPDDQARLDSWLDGHFYQHFTRAPL